jgi:hypothetical protein
MPRMFRTITVPGNDDRQQALNVMHWLARLIN